MSDTHASPPRSQVSSVIQDLLKVAYPLVQYFYTSRPMKSEQGYFNPFHYKHYPELSDGYKFNTVFGVRVSYQVIITALRYTGADKSLAQPTSLCILFDGKNISFDASLVIYT